jgi:hypothetical protein
MVVRQAMTDMVQKDSTDSYSQGHSRDPSIDVLPT